MFTDFFDSKSNSISEVISNLKSFHKKGKHSAIKKCFLMTKNIGAGKLEFGRCLSSQTRC